MNEITTDTAQQDVETEQAVQTEQTGQEIKPEPSDSQNRRKKAKPFVLTAVAVILALAVGTGIYNTPENRLHRQLDLGNRYLEEQQYAQAAIAFEKAITIDDRCMEAYVGGVEAYLAADDVSGAKNFYERTLTMLSALDADFLAENMDYAVELYLSAEHVYDGDPDKIAQVLEGGYEVTGEDTRIKDKLIETYIGTGKEGAQKGSYEEALKIYDRLLELDNSNMEIIDDLCDCLNQYIDDLMEAGHYDKIRALAEKYADVAAKVDFAGILAKITEMEKIEAENRAFMKKVYDLMAAQDYETGMRELYASQETADFIERMEGDSYLYFPDDNDSLNGVGAGVYQFGEGGYYFYYGDYVNGERKGSGTEFVNQYSGYSVFTGVWDQDAPNGEGTVTGVDALDSTGTRYDFVEKGRLVDGLWEGTVSAILTDSRDSEAYDLSFTAAQGVPTEDKTEECLSVASWLSWDREESGYIYAFDYHPSRRIVWWSSIQKGEPVGIIGFCD